MKNFIIFIVLLLACAFTAAANAQTMTFTETSTVTTAATVTVGGKTYDGGTSRTGSIYINRVSGKTGGAYKQYLGTPTKNVHNGNVVFTNKDGDEYFYYTVNTETGWPKKVSLKVAQ